MICAEEIRDLEPDAVGIRGIHVPGTGIVDYGKVAKKYAELITAYGAQILLSCRVVGLRNIHSRTIIETTRGEITARLVINCAGLQSDKISQMVDAKLKLKIIPFRGEYYELSPSKCSSVRGLIYPVPDPRFPFLGVHFTRRIEGGVEAGPNAVLALKREGYGRGSFAFSDVMDLATFPGFWRMAAKYWRTSVEEYYRSLSKEAFLRSLQQLVPNIGMEDLKPGGAGVRAQAVDTSGKLIDDFYFVHTDGIIHVCNVPSPAATASLAIGKYIVDTAVESAGNTLAFGEVKAAKVSAPFV
jgi:L-2-hydroxyglutarate oxidase LhgO